MDNLDSLIRKVNEKLKNKPMFYVCNDPERALGLEKLIKNYHIVCIDHNDIVDHLEKKKVKVFSLEKSLSKQNVIFRNSNRLLKHKETEKYLEKNKGKNGAYFMFFKIAPNLEVTAKALEFDIVNTTAHLNRKYERKISQYNEIKNLDIRIPKTKILKLKDADYSSLTTNICKNLILQFDRSHTGSGTVDIETELDLLELKEKYPEREVRISKNIFGDSYTINACVTKYGIFMGGLSYQITGVPECTSKKGATVGNDWKYRNSLKKKSLNEIKEFTKRVGEKMKTDGYKGMFGVDFVIDKETDDVYFIEINARQPASISMFSKMQTNVSQVPLNLLAILEFLGIEYQLDLEDYNEKATDTWDFSQIFLRNRYDKKAKLIGGVKVGTYRLMGNNSSYDWSKGKPELRSNVINITENRDLPLIYDKEMCSVENIKESGYLILCAKEGKIISSNSEVARIQANESMINDKGNVKALIHKIIIGLNRYIVLLKFPNGRKAS